jgi:uncharacterized protein (DUF2336 family)
MLSRASLIDDLENAIASGSEERRIDTLRRVTELFQIGAQSLSEDQIAVFDDVISRLADDIEIRARTELSRRLAPIANAPVNVVKALASDDEIDVAGPILAQSQRLGEQDLVETAKIKGQGHLLAIAQRASLSESVTDVLVTRGDQQVVRSVARNEGARFSDVGFGVLVKRAEGDDVLAEQVGLRKDTPRKHLRELLARASEKVMKKLAAAGSGSHPHLQKVLADVTAQMKEQAAPPPRDYTAAMAAIQALQKAGKLGDDAVREFARAAKFEETVVALSVMCRLPPKEIEQAVIGNQSEAELVLIVARAAGLSWATTKTILIMPDSGHGSSPQDLEAAQKNFERLQVATAQRVVRFYQVRQSATKAPGAVQAAQ